MGLIFARWIVFALYCSYVGIKSVRWLAHLLNCRCIITSSSFTTIWERSPIKMDHTHRWPLKLEDREELAWLVLFPTSLALLSHIMQPMTWLCRLFLANLTATKYVSLPLPISLIQNHVGWLQTFFVPSFPTAKKFRVCILFVHCCRFLKWLQCQEDNLAPLDLQQNIELYMTVVNFYIFILLCSAILKT